MDDVSMVFIGIDVVAEALDTAESRRWTRTRAPRGLWRRLGVGTGIVLRHPDAPLQVAVAPADSSLRGTVVLRETELEVRMNATHFNELVEDCPVVEELVSAFLGGDLAANAA